MINAYCVKCEDFRDFHQETKGNSWHYYCNECNVKMFIFGKIKQLRKKRMRFQIDSFLESEAKRLKTQQKKK